MKTFSQESEATGQNVRSSTPQNVVEVDEILKDLIPDFMSRRFEEFGQMENWAQQKDYNALAHYGHKLKGSSRNYGFMYLGDLAANLENAAHEQDIESVHRIISEIEDHTKQVKIVYVS